GKAVREAFRNPQHGLVLVSQLAAVPLAELRRAFADVDGDVEHRAARAAYELPLRRRLLVVQRAHDAAHGARLVVLHETDIDAVLAEARGVVSLHEKAAVVGE